MLTIAALSQQEMRRSRRHPLCHWLKHMTFRLFYLGRL